MMAGDFIRRCIYSQNQSPRPFKLQDAKHYKRIGVVVSNFSDLRKKASEKFCVPKHACTIVLEEDGTEVEDDEYLQVLPPHSVLVVLTKGHSWTPARHKLEGALSSLQDANKLRAVQEGVEQLIVSEQRPEILRLLGEITSSITLNIHLDSRRDDPTWFKDLGKNYQNKEQYMRENARRRIRGYHRTAVDFIKRDKTLRAAQRRELFNILNLFTEELRAYDEYSDFFARGSEYEDLRLCDSEGWFRCEGPYDREECEYEQHRVNPYGSWQQRVLFSTWNLDHGIEKSREVLPQLVYAIVNRPRNKQLNWEYFYQLMFTRLNLKLVHVECHDKTEHSEMKCNPKYFYL